MTQEDVDAAHAAFRATLEGRRLPGALELTEAMARASRAARPRRDRRERRGELHRVGASLLRLPALPHAARAALGRDGVRPSVGDRGKARPPRPRRRMHRRRRGLPDERSRARDGGAARGAGCRPRGRQRDVRDDPHAPGAQLPGARRAAPTSGTRTSSPWRSPSAPTRSSSSAARTCRPRSTARLQRVCPPSCTCRSIPRLSRRARRCPRSAPLPRRGSRETPSHSVRSNFTV